VRLCIDTLSKIMTSFVAACEFADRKMKERKPLGFNEGEHWERWICRLLEALKLHSLPTTIRKDTDKNKTGEVSAVVKLVMELQSCVPPEYRRKTNSDHAFAQAMIRARKIGSQSARRRS